jgi:hypothetical protein
MDIRDNVLKRNPEFMRYMDSTYRAPKPKEEFNNGGLVKMQRAGQYTAQRDAVAVNTPAQSKMFGAQREIDVDRFSEDAFKQRYNMTPHQYKMRTDSNYAQAFQRQMDQRRQYDPNYGEINLPETDTRSQLYRGNPNLALIPKGATGPARAQQEQLFADMTSMAAPMLPIKSLPGMLAARRAAAAPRILGQLDAPPSSITITPTGSVNSWGDLSVSSPNWDGSAPAWETSTGFRNYNSGLYDRTNSFLSNTAFNIDRKLGQLISKVRKTPNFDPEEVTKLINENLSKGVGVKKENLPLQVKYSPRSGDEDSGFRLETFIDNNKVGNIFLKRNMEAYEPKTFSEILLNKKITPTKTWENTPGFRKKADFPFQFYDESNPVKDPSGKTFNKVNDLFRTGISGEYNKAINEALKSKGLGNVLSGGTGHSMLGESRWNNLVQKGLAEDLGQGHFKLKKEGGPIVDPRGQWAHPGKVTRIPGSDITMQGVPYPVYGVGSNGQEQMMYPDQEYDFGGASYVDEYPMMQRGGKFMFDFTSKEDAKFNKNRGDMVSYFPEIKRMKEEPKIKEAIAKADQKRQQQILAEAVARGNKNRTTVKQDNRTPRQKEIAQQELLKLKMNEAQGSSPFAQTLSSFTPTGYNPEAGKIAAENIGQMTPMMGATRLFNTVRDPENNPYGIGQGNGFLANTLGTIGLLGDVFDVGAVTAPGVKAAGNYLTQQTPLRNAHKLNPFALTDDVLFNKEGVVNRQMFGDDAYNSFLKFGPTTRPGVSEMDKFMEFIKAPRSQIRSANDEVFEVVKTMEDGVFKYPYFQEGSLWYTGQQRNNLAKELGKERIITTPKSDIWFAPAGEATLMGGDDLVSKSLIDKYSKGRRVLIPGTEYANPSKYSVFEPHWWKGYKQLQKDGGQILNDYDMMQNGGGFFDKMMATINPKNWGVKDYSNAKGFQDAYKSAKKAGEEEFMYNNKRYSTQYAGTPRQEVGAYGVKGKPVPINRSAQVNYYPAFGDYLPSHISASVKNNTASVDYSADGNNKDGIGRVYKKGEKSYNVYGVNEKQFLNKVNSLPLGYFDPYDASTTDEPTNPSTWNLLTNNCADNVCDAFGIPRNKLIQTPIGAISKIKKRYPTLDVTYRTDEDYENLARELEASYPDKILPKAQSILGIASSPDLQEKGIGKKLIGSIQQALYESGYNLPKSRLKTVGHFDGIYGEETKKALDNWKSKQTVMKNGGYTVTRSNDRKGKTHKVTGPDGTVKYFGDSKLGQHPKDPERKAAFYARHKKNLAGNPFFRAFARKTWQRGGQTDSTLENIVEFIEPFGVSSWDDIYKSYQETGMSPQTEFEIFGALPLLGRVGKVGKVLGETLNAAAKTGRQKTNVKLVSDTLQSIPYMGRGTDVIQAFQQFSDAPFFPTAPPASVGQFGRYAGMPSMNLEKKKSGGTIKGGKQPLEKKHGIKVTYKK